MLTLSRSLAALTLGAAITLGALPAQAEFKRFEIDPDHFSVAARIMHAGYYTQTGLFTRGKGSFRYDAESGQLADVVVEIDAKSFFTGHRQRDDHVKGPDFLNSGEFPTITFKMTGYEKTGDNNAKINGDLTIRGQTRPVSVDVILNKAADYPFGHGKYTLGLNGATVFARSDFGMTYALEGGLVADTVALELGFEANLAQ